MKLSTINQSFQPQSFHALPGDQRVWMKSLDCTSLSSSLIQTRMSVTLPFCLVVPWCGCTGLPLSGKPRTPMSGCVSLCTYPGTPSTPLTTCTLDTPLKQNCSQRLWSTFSLQNRKPKSCREFRISSSTKFPRNRFFFLEDSPSRRIHSS